MLLLLQIFQAVMTRTTLEGSNAIKKTKNLKKMFPLEFCLIEEIWRFFYELKKLLNGTMNWVLCEQFKKKLSYSWGLSYQKDVKRVNGFFCCKIIIIFDQLNQVNLLLSTSIDSSRIQKWS